MKQSNDDTYILIEDYLNNTLSSDETAKVKQRMKEDSTFKEEVEWMKGFLKSMKDKKKIQVLEAFNEIHTQTTLQKETKRKRLKQFAGISLLFILIPLALYIGSSEFNTPTTPQPIEQEQEAPQPSPGVEIPQAILDKPLQDFIIFKNRMQLLGHTGDQALKQALILYDNDKKKESLPYFETYLASLNPDDDDYEIKIEAGKIYLNYTKNYARAIELFNSTIESDALSKYKFEAKFYLAISELASGNDELAKEILQEITTQNNDHWKSKSKQLLTLIND